MRTIEEMLAHLARPEVTEFAMVSGRLPCVMIRGEYVPVDDEAPTSADMFQMLVVVGGAEHVAVLGPQPTRWSVNIPGLGLIAVAAVRRGDEIRARFVLQKSDTVAVSPAAPGARGSVALSSSEDGPSAGQVGAQLSASAGQVSAPSVSSRRDNVEPVWTGALEQVLAAARAVRASDLHLVAERPPLFRIAGELIPRGNALEAAVVERMILPRVPRLAMAALEATGSCDFALQHEVHGRFRANVTRQRTGLKVCLRLIPDEIPTLASLGLPDAIAKAVQHHQGLIVITGPTGHGKTTTLAAIVDIINRETTHHVITIEDPVEFVHPRKKAMMSQREVGTHTRSFATALKAALREDPDVIVVGELRDTETVRMALAASETGHLVLATMNTPSAARTIDRLIDLFPPADQAQVRATLAGALRLIVSQRLIPNKDKTGLVAAAELLPGSIALWNLIRENKTYQIPSLQQRGKALGILRLDDSLAELVRTGRVTLETAREYADAPDELEVLVSGQRGVPAPEEPMRGRDGGLLSRAGSLFGRKG